MQLSAAIGVIATALWVVSHARGLMWRDRPQAGRYSGSATHRSAAAVYPSTVLDMQTGREIRERGYDLAEWLCGEACLLDKEQDRLQKY
jgi:hypothetical protein